jgi:hypothetical protein
MNTQNINYNFFNGELMQNDSLDLNSVLFYLPEGKKNIFTNIKTHCLDNDEFIIKVHDRQIVNPTIIEEINKYMFQNNSRSYIFEGFISSGNNTYQLIWSS